MSYESDLRELASHLDGLLAGGHDVKEPWHPHGPIRSTIHSVMSVIEARPDPDCPEGDPCVRWGKWHRVANTLNHELREISARMEEEFSGYSHPLPLGDWSWYGFMHVAGVDWERIRDEAKAERLAAESR